MSRPTLIVHAVPAPDDVASTRDAAGRPGPRIGFVVSGALGNAVTRNRVKRRLRHLAAAHVADTPVEIDIVVRALPRAATDPADVPTDFGSAWHEAVYRLSCAPAGRGRRRAMKYLLIGLLKLYRLVISPLYGNVCRYYPELFGVRAAGGRGPWSRARQLAGAATAAALPPLGRGRVRPRTGNP